MTAPHWQHVRRILCVRLDYLGDVLMSSPALRALRASFRGCRLTLLTSPGGAAAARFVPEIDDTIVYAAPWLKSSDAHAPAIDLAMIDRLARERFDAAVIFTVYSQNPLPSALLCYLAGIPLRLAHCRENPYRLLSDWIAESEPHERVRHEVRRQLDLVAAIGAHTGNERLSFAIPPADLRWAHERLHACGIDTTQPWMALHPGASAPSRRYPPEHWSTVARRLSQRLGCPLLFTGNADEQPLVDEIRAAVPRTCSLAGELDLGKLGAVISLAPVLVSNNTGPVHIAAAVGTPVVDLYALTNPQHTPWQVPSRVLFEDVDCRYCYKSICPQQHHRCLAGVAPERVVQAALELLDSSSHAASFTDVLPLPLTQ